MASSSSTKKITLKSSDSVTFEIEEVVFQSIKNLTDDVADDIEILVPRITGKILAKVIEYCKKHVEAASSYEKLFDDKLNKWYTEFVEVDNVTLFNLIWAASILDLSIKTLADMIKDKKPEDIGKIFNIINAYRPE
ncbi:putative S-phase kinase-associated protein [Medicago truncatula]|uniref:SKP1-like protein n=1 Tax=Medicago truncatula TaxID=3880 RepID=A2Q4Y2_MEDTR|nr:SKP1-like protein 1A [Medicago truncatula]ABN08682.1 SKP1 component [Medicago truncatula]AES77251.1 SCF ubiquitin ligase, SKP1 component [Medicago truncatula]RHN44011.1 putative S-phase kinase-associated protein [Medicago truncatula]